MTSNRVTRRKIVIIGAGPGGLCMGIKLKEAGFNDFTILGLADGGAHVAAICDASQPTYMLTHWARDRTRGAKLPLEQVVKKQTSEPANLYGLGDRGTIQVGKRADLNLIDFDRLTLPAPYAVRDLPAGGMRLLQDASGYAATVVNGVVTREHDEHTGERPGRLIRGKRSN